MGGSASVKLSRFFFTLRCAGEVFEDFEGTFLPDEAAALVHTRRIIRELKETGDYDNATLVIVVRNTTGSTLFSIPF